MTLQRFLRTMLVAILGASALAYASYARAEGGEGSSIVPPDRYATDAAAGPVSDAQAAAEDEKPATTASLPTRSRAASADEARAGALRSLVARYASEHEVPFALADAVIRIESRYNPRVRNGANVGLTQINVRTAQSLGYHGGTAGLLDAETNLRYGLQYLGEAYRLAGGDTCGTVLRFQFGHRAQAMNRASRAYCARVKTLSAKAD